MIKMPNKQCYLTLHNMAFNSFGWRLQRKSLYSQSLLVHELKFPGKKMVRKFCTPHQECHAGKILFSNSSKIITNWFLILQPDIS